MSIRFTTEAALENNQKIDVWRREIESAAMRSEKADLPLKFGKPYAVIYLALADIAAGNKIAGIVCPTAWRQSVSHGESATGDLEFNEALEPIAFHEGPAKDGLRAAIAVAENVEGDFEASVLECAPLRFIALWLHSDTEDWVIPFAPNLTDLPNGEPIAMSEATSVLQSAAKAVLEAMEVSDHIGG